MAATAHDKAATSRATMTRYYPDWPYSYTEGGWNIVLCRFYRTTAPPNIEQWTSEPLCEYFVCVLTVAANPAYALR